MNYSEFMDSVNRGGFSLVFPCFSMVFNGFQWQRGRQVDLLGLERALPGDVEMVRVQPDALSAQYVTKDGARREVNLIPNAQIQDSPVQPAC